MIVHHVVATITDLVRSLLARHPTRSACSNSMCAISSTSYSIEWYVACSYWLCGCYTPRFESAAKVALTLLQPKIPESIHQLEHSLTPFPSSVFSKTFTKIILVLSDEFTYSWWVEIFVRLEIYFGWVKQPSAADAPPPAPQSERRDERETRSIE
jgi:hypothetical protein